MVDVHTASGRHKGATPVHFALVGAAVAAQDLTLHDDKCQAVYVMTKVLNGLGREVKADEDIVRIIREHLEEFKCLGPSVFAEFQAVVEKHTAAASAAFSGPVAGDVTVLGGGGAGGADEKEDEDDRVAPLKRARVAAIPAAGDAIAALIALCGVCGVPFVSEREPPPAGFEEALGTGVWAQKLTSTIKVPVWMGRDIVVKGPYPPHKTALLNSIVHTALLTALHTCYDEPLGPEMDTVLPIASVVCRPGGSCYIITRNIGKSQLDEGAPSVDVVADGGPLNFGKKVVQRSSYDLRASARDRSGSGLNSRQRTAVLQHMYERAVLGIGDSGLYNVLVVEPRAGLPTLAVGIDFDEVRSDEFTPGSPVLSLLFSHCKQPAKETWARYKPVLCTVKRLNGDRVKDGLVSLLTTLQAVCQLLPPAVRTVTEYSDRARALNTALEEAARAK